jgi:putative FmdB family regulatory protein
LQTRSEIKEDYGIMPIYEYRCESCGHEFERLARSADRDAARGCPDCSTGTVTRKLSTFGTRVAGGADPAPSTGGGCGCTPASCGCRVH